MRGKLFSAFADDAIVRITPAGAGKTCIGVYSNAVITDHPRRCGENADNRIILPKLEDHPRRCGENHFVRQCRCYDVGSPPQVRGKPIL